MVGASPGESRVRGGQAGTIPVAVPQTVVLALNLRSARHVNLPIPRELEAEAGEVIR